jgi:transposase
MSAEKMIFSDDEFIECVKKGLPNDELAKKFFISISTVWRRKREFNIVRKKIEIDVKMYKRMKQIGLYDRQVAHILGCSYRTVQDFKEENGLINRHFGRKRNVQ